MIHNVSINICITSWTELQYLFHQHLRTIIANLNLYDAHRSGPDYAMGLRYVKVCKTMYRVKRSFQTFGETHLKINRISGFVSAFLCILRCIVGNFARHIADRGGCPFWAGGWRGALGGTGRGTPASTTATRRPASAREHRPIDAASDSFNFRRMQSRFVFIVVPVSLAFTVRCESRVVVCIANNQLAAS